MTKDHKLIVDKTGRQYGRLTVIRSTGEFDNRFGAMWLCICACGKEVVVGSSRLQDAYGPKSCGCLVADRAKEIRLGKPSWNHGLTYSISDGEHIYRSKQAWAFAVARINGYNCQKCGWNKAKCDAHHIVPISHGGKNTLNNGIMLCPNCHREEHCALS